MKLLLPGGSGAGGIINWGGRVQKNFFLPGGSGAGGIISWGGRVQNHFSDLTLFFDIQFKIWTLNEALVWRESNLSFSNNLAVLFLENRYEIIHVLLSSHIFL